jgi:hypothetical protein
MAVKRWGGLNSTNDGVAGGVGTKRRLRTHNTAELWAELALVTRKHTGIFGRFDVGLVIIVLRCVIGWDGKTGRFGFEAEDNRNVWSSSTLI